MEIICDQCGKRMNIPDEKIPANQRVSLSCPKCGKKLTIDGQGPVKREAPQPAEETPELESRDYDEQDTFLDTFEEGVPLALAMVEDKTLKDVIKRSVEELGYKFVPAANSHDANGKMRFHNFDLMIIGDGFDGAPVANSPILNYLNHQPMSIRRKIFVALLGDDFRTRDALMAYSLSSNLVVNNKDLGQITSILKNSIAENNRFYKVFMDTMVEVGRA